MSKRHRDRRQATPPGGRPAATPPGAPAPVTVAATPRPAPARPTTVPTAYRSGQRRTTRRIRTPAVELELLAVQRARMAQRERVAVKAARAEGLSWQAIATALDLPLQTVYRHHRDRP